MRTVPKVKSRLSISASGGGSVLQLEVAWKKHCADRLLNAFNLGWKRFKILCAKNKKKQER